MMDFLVRNIVRDWADESFSRILAAAATTNIEEVAIVGPNDMIIAR